MSHEFNVWSKPEGTYDETKNAIIGIDLGTSTSCVAIWNIKKSRVKIIKNGSKERTTPSLLRFLTSFDSPLVGNDATSITSDGMRSACIIRNWKRLLSCETCDFPPDTPWEVDPSRVSGESTLIDPEVLSSHILRALKSQAEAYLATKPLGKSFSSCQVTHAVIGIPVDFPSRSIDAMRRASVLAGFEKVSFLVESTAAAMAYGLLVAGTKCVLVFDMGGGTLDLTVHQIENGKIVETVSHGDPVCGGQDIDSALCSFIRMKLSEFRLRPDTDFDSFLIENCKKIKETLSSERSTVLNITAKYLESSEDLNVTISREDLESVMQDVLVKMSSAVRTLIIKWNINHSRSSQSNKIDEVVLVGGCSQVPIIRETLKNCLVSEGCDIFESRPFCSAVNPNEAVAEGLAIRAAVEMGYDVDGLKSTLMMDSIPSNLGIVVDEGTEKVFIPILHAGASLPATASVPFSLLSPDERKVTLSIYYEKVCDQNIDCGPNALVDLVLIAIEDFSVPCCSSTDNSSSVDVVFSVNDEGKLKVYIKRASESNSDAVDKAVSEKSSLILYSVIAVFFLVYLFAKIYLISASDESNANVTSYTEYEEF